jgi:hypothetical protein
MAIREDLQINKMTSPVGNAISFAAAAPTTGTAKRGDIVFNTLPSASGVFAWSCTTAGSPGTWKAVATAA